MGLALFSLLSIDFWRRGVGSESADGEIGGGGKVSA